MLLIDVTGLTIDLGPGTNTVTLAAGTNSLDGLYNINQINGSSTDDVLTLTQQSFGTIDMGGGNDTVNFVGTAGTVIVVNAETVNGSIGNDFIAIGNTSGTTMVTGGMGADNITASVAADNFNFNSAAESQTGNGDTVVSFNAANDAFVFTNMTGPNGFTGPIHFVGTGGFDGTAGSLHSDARVDGPGANATLQIDVNGDGQFGSGDMEIHLVNYTGTLTDANFLLH
ncbi:hypothetical protein IVB40_28100 [Bradyrhizobium sp. 40]|uniref:hypothetical protein n=1 Tax=Bradyrhizobium sp. 40 TaxID=2782674 RepID=UPI001FFF708E|nr:hypothetical protein [Bradyrhizobium sp. 40]UPJ41118.1 hypothetical protein IVB40_28100 [Bradyrhizobium sp. 40]